MHGVLFPRDGYPVPIDSVIKSIIYVRKSKQKQVLKQTPQSSRYKREVGSMKVCLCPLVPKC